MAALILENTKRCGTECEMLRLCDRQPDPSRRERRAKLAVREQRDIPG